MSVSAISSSSSVQIQAPNDTGKLRQYYQQLASDLKSGNLSGAQQAYGSMQQLLQNEQSSSTASNPQYSQVQKDFAALGQALSSGNLSQAQSDLSQLQTALKAASQNSPSGAEQTLQAAHRGHHHHGHASEATSSDTTSSTTTTAATTSTSGSSGGSTGTTVNVYA